jgi:hypothetical protein
MGEEAFHSKFSQMTPVPAGQLAVNCLEKDEDM